MTLTPVQSLNTILNALSLAALIGGAYYYSKSKIPSETIENQSKLIEALNGRIQILEDLREQDRQSQLENNRQMGILQGQVETYRNLPLTAMAENMTEIAKTNSQILATLKSPPLVVAAVA